MDVRAWPAPGALRQGSASGVALGALKAFDCVEVVPKEAFEVGAPNAEGEPAGAPNADAGAAPKAPAGLPNTPGLFPPPNAPPPPKPPENVMLTRTCPDEWEGMGVIVRRKQKNPGVELFTRVIFLLSREDLLITARSLASSSSVCFCRLVL